MKQSVLLVALLPATLLAADVIRLNPALDEARLAVPDTGTAP